MVLKPCLSDSSSCPSALFSSLGAFVFSLSVAFFLSSLTGSGEWNLTTSRGSSSAMKQKKSYSNLSVKKPAQVNWAAVHRLENPMVYTGLCMRPGILTIHLQGGQLMEHTLKLSKSGSSGGKGDSPKSGIIPLQGCPLASKEQGPARAWGTYQYCFCLPQCISPGWPCQQVTDILKKVILLSSLSSPAL